jgi:2-aminoethylphosphonate-pyruvate transaminase
MKMRLFTPGPLNTSNRVRTALNYDLGSREPHFKKTLEQTRNKILELSGLDPEKYTSVLLPGSGTNMLEASLRLMKQNRKRLLIITNGAYGERLGLIAKSIGLDYEIQRHPELEAVNWSRVEDSIELSGNYTSLAMVHCETSTGQLNDLAKLRDIANEHQLDIYLDGMSSFAGVAFDYSSLPLAILVSSSNKCLHGIPGFGLALLNKGLVEEQSEPAGSVALDLKSHWKSQKAKSEFLFTPPTHALVALLEAIHELEESGGISQRASLYSERCEYITAHMTRLGFTPLLAPELRSNIITAYEERTDVTFPELYEGLCREDCVIYPGKASDTASFRIGNIGDLTTGDLEHLVTTITRIIHQKT